MEMVSEPGHHEALTTNWLFTVYLFLAIFPLILAAILNFGI